MTRLQLQRIENELSKRGYRKSTKNLSSSESYGWFKTFVLAEDEDGETRDGYVVEFRVWGPYEYTDNQSRYGLDVYIAALHLKDHYGMEAGWWMMSYIDRSEAMAKEFHQLVRKYDSQPSTDLFTDKPEKQ